MQLRLCPLEDKNVNVSHGDKNVDVDDLLMKIKSCLAPTFKEIIKEMIREEKKEEDAEMKDEPFEFESEAHAEQYGFEQRKEQPTKETSVTSPLKAPKAVSDWLSFSQAASNRPKPHTPSKNPAPVNKASTPIRPAHGSPKMVQKSPINKTKGKGTVKGPKRTSTRVRQQGLYDVIMPPMPECDECFLHYYMSRMATAELDTKNALRADFRDDYLVDIANGVATIARDFNWQLQPERLLGDTMIDCTSHILHLTDKNRTDGAKKIWFLPCLYAVLGQRNMTGERINRHFLGDIGEMGMIAMPLNVTDLHYLLMVLNFGDKRCYILDPMGKPTYREENIKLKLSQLHQNFIVSLGNAYAELHDITDWPIVYNHDHIPRQTNSFDCGAYVCFYLANLRDLIPEPKQVIKINEDWIRIWLANFIGRSVYNERKEELLDGLKKFKSEPNIEEQFAKEYRNIPCVYAKYKGQYL